MSDLDVISSSDEDDVTCSNKVIYQSPPKKKSNLKPKCSFSNTSKTILYTEETIGPHVKYLLRLVDSCKIKHNKNSLELNNLFNECHVYFRINEILCMDVGDMSHLKKVKVLGLYKNNGKYDILLDKTYSTKLYLNFTESIPISLSNVIVFGYLSLSKESKPILNVYSWEYINELLIKSYDNSMYSQRLHIQNIKKNLLSSKIDTECDIEMDSFDDNFMKQQDELLQQEFKQCLNISSDLF